MIFLDRLPIFFEDVYKRQLLELEPVTGRTHQLRVHCADGGFPILGDPQYGTPASQAVSAQRGFSTQQLCAARLIFPHPMTGAAITLHSRRSVSLFPANFSGSPCQERKLDV